jgi:hypothetical protein
LFIGFTKKLNWNIFDPPNILKLIKTGKELFGLINRRWEENCLNLIWTIKFNKAKTIS